MKSDVNFVIVGIACGATAKAPTHLRTLGLGSCVAVMLYDLSSQMAGLVHILLPESPVAHPAVPTKFADTAVPWLVDRLLAEGADLTGIVAKLAGGAQMFAPLQLTNNAIGARNVEVCHRMLKRYSIRVAAEDVGGNYGRSVDMETKTGAVAVHTAVRGTYVL